MKGETLRVQGQVSLCLVYDFEEYQGEKESILLKCCSGGDQPVEDKDTGPFNAWEKISEDIKNDPVDFCLTLSFSTFLCPYTGLLQNLKNTNGTGTRALSGIWFSLHAVDDKSTPY